jgi:hypothetical protein
MDELATHLAIAIEDPGGEEGNVEPEFAQRDSEKPIELVTEPAATLMDDLAVEGIGVENDRAAAVDVEVFERNRHQERAVQRYERLHGGVGWSAIANAIEEEREIHREWL